MKNENEAVVDHRSKIAGLNGKLGMIKRWKPQDVEGMRAAKRAVVVAKIEQAIDKATADGVNLTVEDVDYLTSVLQRFIPLEDV